MRKLLFNLVVYGTLLGCSVVEAAPIKAKVILSSGGSWQASLLGRSGNTIEFSKGAGKIPLQVKEIRKIVFNLDLDTKKLSEQIGNREYEQVISVLEPALKPFAEYGDIPSNLTRYNVILMDLQYKSGRFDRAAALAADIAEDDRNPELQEKGRAYQLLSLIATGRVDEGEELLAKYGWNENLEDTVSSSRLYVSAKLLIEKKEYAKALELAAKVAAYNDRDSGWLPPAELLCAELYAELGMYDSSEEVIRQISILYEDTDEYVEAQKLKARIENLREAQETL